MFRSQNWIIDSLALVMSKPAGRTLSRSISISTFFSSARSGADSVTQRPSNNATRSQT